MSTAHEGSATPEKETDTEETLIAEFKRFCAAHNLPHKSASDLRHDPSLTPEQASFIAGFIERWEAMEELQS